jgi:hypothetical protein
MRILSRFIISLRHQPSYTHSRPKKWETRGEFHAQPLGNVCVMKYNGVEQWGQVWQSGTPSPI